VVSFVLPGCLQGTAEGLALRGYKTWGEDGDRPFVLSRAFFAGEAGHLGVSAALVLASFSSPCRCTAYPEAECRAWLQEV
jgi:hypothetical protein